MNEPRSTSSSASSSREPAFLFPGQGSYDSGFLHELYTGYPETVPGFVEADAAARRLLGAAFLPLVTEASAERRRELADATPDLQQLGIFLAGVLTARLLERHGVRPSLFVGHSFGEIAALGAADVFDLPTGLEIVCQRVLALRSVEIDGAMASLSCGPDRVEELLAQHGGRTIEIAVLNHPRQTVVSGPRRDLEALAVLAAAQGVSLTLLASRYPFHSSHLAGAVDRFAASLRACTFAPPRVPVYLAMEGKVWSPELDLPALLASQLTRRLDFAGAVRNLHASGTRRFIESGPSDLVSKLVLKNLSAAAPEVTAEPVVRPGEAVRQSLERIARSTDAALRTELAQLLREAVERIERAERMLDRIAAEPAPRQQPAERPAEPPVEVCPQTPVAIVAMGCILPGAADPDELWRNVLTGVSGIVDLTELDPDLGRDFVAGRGGAGEIVPDKTYTLLSGAIRQVAWDARLAGFYEEPEFAALTRGQKLLACALGQAVPGIAGKTEAGRMQCILGATADGSSEYDEALFLDSVRSALSELDAPQAERRALLERIEQLPGLRAGASEALRQHELYRAVAGRLLGDGARTYVVDSACSSSLYAVDLGLKALRDGAADCVVAGGVFAPGPANNALFAQFRGLTPSASRPLDAAADGVVFGDGGAVVVLKRLPDALAAGDRVLGVIRGLGLSSDGKSPAINVPQSAGQCLAIRRAYAASGIPLDSIQLIEAHATATPVGDAVEIRALAEVFGGRPADLPRIQLGSVKALLGHTGWVSGVSSLIKILQAFAHETIPPQHNFTEPAPGLGLDATPFEIARTAQPWPARPGAVPRRAGINGFGFGGTNAHLVVEAFDEAYHRRLRGPETASPQPPQLTVVGVASLFPAADRLAGEAPSPTAQFQRSALRLPKGKLLLPDVTEHMDPSQFLAALAAEKILSGLPRAWQELREATGVVLGLEGKTERGVRANERIFLDRLRRLAGLPSGDGLVAALAARLAERNPPSGPYTLSGLMPNVAASRVSSLFDLKGPNLVIDMGAGSLVQALAAAAGLLAHGDCRMVLAGGLHAAARDLDNEAEGVLLLALTTPETARALALPELATLRAAAPGEAPPLELAAGGRQRRGATGAAEVLEAVRRGRLLLPPPEAAITFAPAKAAAPPAPVPAPPRAPEPPATHAYVQGTPIETYGPVLVAAPATAPAASLAGCKLLVLTDQPALWADLAAMQALEGAAHTLVCPADVAVPGAVGGDPAAGAVAVDLSSDEGIAATATALDNLDFDTIVAVHSLAPCDPRSLLRDRLEHTTRLLDLLFAVCRHVYPALGRGAASLYTLCLDAFADGRPHPATGLLGGFVKSLARELPAAVIRSVHTDAAEPQRAWRQLLLEMGQPPAAVEVCWRGDHRETFALAPLAELAADAQPCLSAGSVVLATAGGRGVTAVMSEELLRRFGCTVIAIGRTDPGAIPDALAAMTEAELAAYEGRFYREELARDPSRKMPEVKRRFAEVQAVHELRCAIASLERLPGRFVYRRVDLGDEAAVADLVDDIYARFGRLDLVVHGAGIQISKILPKKSLADFRKIVGTKLAGLSAIHRACRRHAGGPPVHYHLLTSAFSYLGNDGQPDYGAANEAMNRLAGALDGRDGGAVWSSLAWLGWAGIGMTRGSEFAALAASRRLRGVTHDEGRDIFGRLMAGRPSSPATVLLAAGEREHYRPLLAAPAQPSERRPQPARRPLESSLVVPLAIDLESAPYLHDHLVQGVPTLPGAFLLGIAGDAARRLRPGMRITAFENTSFRRFVRVYPGRPTHIRLDTRIVEEGGPETLIRVQVLSDFVHKSGAVLQKDVVQTEIFIRLTENRNTESPASAPSRANAGELRDAIQLPDPYLLEGSPVRLNGRFKSLSGLRVNGNHRLADYRLSNSSYPESPLQHMLPNVILVDAFWRFGTIMATGDHALSVYVPERCDRMGVYFDYTDFSLDWLHDPLVFSGANPRTQGEQLLVGPIEARDRDGRLRLTVEGGVCRKFGEIQNAF